MPLKEEEVLKEVWRRFEGGGGFGEGRGRRSNKAIPKKNSDAGHGRYHRHITVRDVGCDGHDKRSTGVRVLLFKKYGGDWGLILSSHNRKGGNCKRMNVPGKGIACKGYGDLLLLLMFCLQRRSLWRMGFGGRKCVDWETVTLWKGFDGSLWPFFFFCGHSEHLVSEWLKHLAIDRMLPSSKNTLEK